MKKKSWTKILVAAVVITVLADSAIAGGRLLMVNSHSGPLDEFKDLPDSQWVAEKLDVEPASLVMPEAFSNGYRFESGRVRKNDLVMDGNSQTGKYQSLSLTYTERF